MKHLIMGTAGHIDHGKTTLVQKLTGFDCDTHKEEKERGITIQLGFTHFNLSNDEKVGIIDVPGHADFVNTMVAGAASIDFVLLIIAVDAGIMPQTEEHLSIMKMLGIKKGIVVLTKIDLVEPEYVELIEEEVKEFTSGTFLEESPIIRFSGVTGSGLNDIKSAIEKTASEIEPRITKELFRLYIDRLFTLRGLGTIAAGTVRSGKIDKKSKLFVFPGYKPVRVRKMERYGAEVNELIAGDRGSLNLTGIDKDELQRGMLLSDGMVQGTDKIDAVLKLFAPDTKLDVWSQCILLHGSEHYEVRIHLLDTDVLTSGNSAIVQIHLKKPLYACFGDRFVVRNSSSDITLGGGEIIDVRPLHHKRRTKKLLSNLNKIVEGGIEELIASEVRKRLDSVTVHEIISLFNMSEQEIMKIITSDLPEDIVALSGEDDTFLVEKGRYERLRKKIQRHLQTYHKNNPLEEYGKTFDELMGLFGKERTDILDKYMQVVLDNLTKENKLKKVSNTWVLATHQVVLSSKVKKDMHFVEDFLKECGLRVPLMSLLKPAAAEQGIDGKLLLQILKLLTNRGKVYRIENNYIHSSIVDSCRIKLLEALLQKKKAYSSQESVELNQDKSLNNNTNEADASEESEVLENEGITIAGFRDLIDGNRKICLLLQGLYDTEGLTVRKGDYRIITEKGKNFLRQEQSS